ncbi:hypothetical protein BDK51DRAFT_26390 [Blyttiomyces helicus]|uniref:Uncharacterized protein n=1 Tax=Blyttiomyces helicus TaxID=388810 RepID=A0A4P9W5F5_9FUNG|nr:hypothetical protein BDK51DRAFT_26390 [Blyttiomyces helicus]|eukprot:RKO86535.1 hypothetical protein BDK51DRAFT_26390 [Blyttiomyces helicus]
MGRDIKPYTFNMEQVEGFRYRCEDGLRAVTRAAVKEARIKELKQEILNSEKLKAHFEDNPTDLLALRHDKTLHPARVQAHMRHVPDYLLPKRSSGGTAATAVGHVPYRVDKRRRGAKAGRGGAGRGGGGARDGAKKRKADPLKSFSFKGPE